MNRIMTYGLIGGFFISNTISGALENKLVRLFHHRGSNASNEIELGKAVLYFSSTPVIQELPSGQNGNKSFSVDRVYVDQSLNNQIAAFNAISPRDYKISLRAEKSKLIITITYSPEKVGLDWVLFRAIKNEIALEFRFFNNECIGTLNKISKPVLQFVSLEKRPRIVIDCGHGGDDFGAVGYNQATEKDITLDVGKSLAQLLQSLGGEILLTREDDSTLAVDERTSYANAHHADILISIHANAAARQSASGIELFCLPSNGFQHLGTVLSSDAHSVVDRLCTERNKHSFMLAQSLHGGLISVMKDNNISVVDRSVKRSFAQILDGSSMLAVLIEVGFVTNMDEAIRLQTKEYKELLARGIYQGLNNYFAHPV
jgi:N-acetylmuramoyl-L-alanine amidase